MADRGLVSFLNDQLEHDWEDGDRCSRNCARCVTMELVDAFRAEDVEEIASVRALELLDALVMLTAGVVTVNEVMGMLGFSLRRDGDQYNRLIGD